MEKNNKTEVLSKECSFLIGLSITLRRDYSEVMSLMSKPENAALVSVQDIKIRVQELLLESRHERLDHDDIDMLMQDIKLAIESGLALGSFPRRRNLDRVNVRFPIVRM